MNSAANKVLVLHGPNLNLLGRREREIYGDVTLDQINEEIAALGAQLGIEVGFAQSNREGGVLIEQIHQAAGVYEWLIFNRGGHSAITAMLCGML